MTRERSTMAHGTATAHDPGPNHPAIIHRTADDVAEARQTIDRMTATIAWTAVEALDAETKERFYGLLEDQKPRSA